MEDCLDFDQGLAQDMPQAGGVHPQIIVGPAQAQIIEKNLVEFVIVVLASVNHFVIHMPVQQLDNRRQADDFGTGSDNRHDFQFGLGHFHTLSK